MYQKSNWDHNIYGMFGHGHGQTTMKYSEAEHNLHAISQQKTKLFLKKNSCLPLSLFRHKLTQIEQQDLLTLYTGKSVQHWCNIQHVVKNMFG